MNAFTLMLALHRVLIDRYVTLPLATRKRSTSEQEVRSPKVLIGQLPPKTAVDLYEAPLALIQAMSGFESEGWQHADIAIRFLVFNDDPEGSENDLHNLISATRLCLMQFRQTPLENYYVLEETSNKQFLPWTRPDDQAPPFLEGYILSSWRMPGIE